MNQPVLTNKDEFPTDDLIFSHIGDSKTLWETFFEHIGTNHPELSKEWRYYKDGKSWLLKVTKKAKTIFWLSLVEDTFRTTFYFTDKAAAALDQSSISDELKEQFRNGKHYNKIRGLTVTFKEPQDIEYAKSLITIKMGLK